MKIWYVVLGLIIILVLVSLIDIPSEESKIDLVVRDNKMTTYVIGKESDVQKIFRGPSDIKPSRVRFFEYEEHEEELERCINKITRNWYRFSENDYTLGFDEEEDAMFKFRLRNRLKKGEKIC